MSEDPNSAYVHGLTACVTLADLRALIGQHSELAVDAGQVAATMTEADMTEFRRGLRQERKGRFAGESWARRFGAILMPMPMIRVAQIASEYGVPFTVALRRIKDVRPELLKIEEPAQTEGRTP